MYPVCTDLHIIALSSYRVPAGYVVWSVGFVGATSYLRRTMAEALDELDFLRIVNPNATVTVSAN